MKKLMIAMCCAIVAAVASADETALGTLVLEENFADYAKITNGVVTIQGTSITPLTSHITNAGLNNSLSNDTSAKTATVKINNVSATMYTTAGVSVANDSSAGTATVTVGANAATVYSKSKTDTLLSGKAATATTLAGYGITDAKVEEVTGGYKITLGNGYVTWYDWALAATKPGYTFAEIAATPTTLAGYGITDAVSNIAWDSTNKKLTKTIGGTTSDVVTGANLLTGIGAVPTSRKVNGKALSADVTIYGGDIKRSASDSTTLNGSIDSKVALAKVQVNGTAITSSTVVELGQCYIKYTTTGGKTTATLYAR